MLHLSDVLTSDEVRELRMHAARAPWLDGRATASGGASRAKRNEQVDETSPQGRAIGERVLAALKRHPLFAAAAFPARLSPPLVNRYLPGMEYAPHVDSSLMGFGDPLRTDLSATLFLSEPSEYDGGELVIEGTTGRQAVKLAAGDLFLYPSTRVHFVAPVTRGDRVAVIFWVQSLIRDAEQRSTLLEMSQALAGIEKSAGHSAELVTLAACYHRLVQMWAET